MDDTSATSTHTARPEVPDFALLGLAAAAQAIRSGEITSEAYATGLLQQARTLADLNSFITIAEDAVLAAAKNADKARSAGSTGQLLGVPLGVKDSYLTAGLPTSLGLDSLAHFIPREDADAVRAIKDAGALVFGKNNLVEMSYGLTGHNERYGQVKNPRARDRVTGGSSSGSAASVAAGIVPASLGGDSVGSIRSLHRSVAWSGSSQPPDVGRATALHRSKSAHRIQDDPPPTVGGALCAHSRSAARR